MTGQPLVGVVMGSDSDWPVMRAAADALDEFGVAYEADVVSAHRMPREMVEYGSTAAGRGLRVIIAGAGGAAHLPGMLASVTPLPVIGVPVPLAHLDGLDSLLSIVQMPAGIPVATVAVGGARNAGLLAVRILATADDDLRHRMTRFQDQLAVTARAKGEALRAQRAAGSPDPAPDPTPRPCPDPLPAPPPHRHAAVEVGNGAAQGPVVPAGGAPAGGVERIPAVHDVALGHRLAEFFRVGVAELLPLGQQQGHVGTGDGLGPGAGVGQLRVGPARVAHRRRIVDAHRCAQSVNGGGDVERGGVPDVVGVGLEGDAKHADGAALERSPGQLAREIDHPGPAPHVDAVHLAQERHGRLDPELLGPGHERADVLGQAAAAEAEPRAQRRAADSWVVAERLGQRHDVGVRGLAHLRHGVDEGDLRGQEGVRGHLDQLRGGQVGGEERRAGRDRVRVHLPQDGFARGRTAPPRRSGRAAACPERRALRAGTPDSTRAHTRPRPAPGPPAARPASPPFRPGPSICRPPGRAGPAAARARRCTRSAGTGPLA